MDFSGRRVLVVEDEYFIAKELSDRLIEAGAKVVGPCASHEQAFAALAVNDVDLAVIDINLLGRVEFTLAEQLISRGIPFVFATGYDVTIVPSQFHSVPVWEKPFATEALLEALASAGSLA